MIRHLKLDVRDVSDNLKNIQLENTDEAELVQENNGENEVDGESEELEEFSTETSIFIIEKVLESLDGSNETSDDQ